MRLSWNQIPPGAGNVQPKPALAPDNPNQCWRPSTKPSAGATLSLFLFGGSGPSLAGHTNTHPTAKSTRLLGPKAKPHTTDSITHLIQCLCRAEGMAAQCGTPTSGPSSAARCDAAASAAPASALQDKQDKRDMQGQEEQGGVTVQRSAALLTNTGLGRGADVIQITDEGTSK